MHLCSLHLLIDGLLLHAYGLTLIGFAVLDLVLIQRIDYAADVLQIQKRLAELHTWRLRSGIWFAMAGCFMWAPFTLVCLYWAGADIWIQAPSVVFWFVASGFACLAVVYGLARWTRRPVQARLARVLYESAVGRSLKRAQDALTGLEQLERE